MTRGEQVIAFIERYCKVPEGTRIGEPIELADFEIRFILAIYDNPDGTDTAYLSIARKNGKTALIACLVIVHLLCDGIAIQNSQIVSGALSREQAGIVFSLAVKIIKLDETLSSLIHIIPSSKKLIGKPMNVEYKALAAEGKTTHGLSPVLAILDEVGQIRGTTGPEVAFVDAIITAQGAHDSPLLIAISTQSAGDADLFSIWLDDAAKSDDPHIVSHVYEAPEDCELDDREAWAAANPALGLFRSEKDMRRLCDKAIRMPTTENRFRNLNLNQRVSQHSPFVSLSTWKNNGGEPSPLEGMRVYGGLDLSAKIDLTAAAFLGIKGEERHVNVMFWTPEEGLEERSRNDRAPYDLWVKEGFIKAVPGRSVNYEFVARDIMEFIAPYNLIKIGFDRWRIDVLKKDMESVGIELPLEPCGQGFKDMSPAIDEFEEALLNGNMRHGNNPVLAMCAANALVVKDPAGNRKFDKSKSTGRIDGLVALAMAFWAASSSEEKPMDIDAFISDPLVF